MAVLHIRETHMRASREITTIYSAGGGLRRHFPDQYQDVGPVRLQQLVDLAKVAEQEPVVIEANAEEPEAVGS
jgi:hypothetical protein